MIPVDHREKLHDTADTALPVDTPGLRDRNSNRFWDIDGDDPGYGLAGAAAHSAPFRGHHSSVRGYLEGSPVQARI